MVDAMQEMGF